MGHKREFSFLKVYPLVTRTHENLESIEVQFYAILSQSFRTVVTLSAGLTQHAELAIFEKRLFLDSHAHQ